MRTSRRRFQRCLVAIGLVVPVLVLAAQSARADVGIERISPSAGVLGEEIEVTVGCGFCFPPCSSSAGARAAVCMPSRHARSPEKYSFPILLVPIERPLAPRRCGANALCGPTSVGLPRRPPFIRLGRAWPAFGCGDLDRPGALPRYRLRFRIPAVEPGVYHLVIYSGPKTGPGSLIADARRWRLRVRQPDPVTAQGPVSAQGGGPAIAPWVSGATVALVLPAIAVLRRRRAATHGRAVRAHSTSR